MKKAADISDIFGAKASVPAKPTGDDFWNFAASPVRASSGGDEEEDFQLTAFEVEKVPEQKTRQQVISEGIDRSPMLSVQEIRARFNKDSKPVFPKQIFVASKKTTRQEQVPMAAAPEEKQAAVAEQQHTTVQDRPQPTASPPQSPSRRLLSKEEFSNIVGLHGCHEALEYYTTPRAILLIIKQDASSPSLVKPMELQYSKEHRLLVMIRKNATRYLRLNDVIRVDGRDASLVSVVAENIVGVATKKPIALHFTTAALPLIIMTDTEQERELLLKLIIFLRELLKTDRALEVLL